MKNEKIQEEKVYIPTTLLDKETEMPVKISTPEVAEVKPLVLDSDKNIINKSMPKTFGQVKPLVLNDNLLEVTEERTTQVKKIAANIETTLMSGIKIAGIIFLLTHHFTCALLICAVKFIKDN